MARLSAFFLVFLLGAASAVALVSCGGGDSAELLPGTTADQIESNLDEVEQLADAGDCIGAESAVAEVAAEVEELQVDLKLKAALQEGTAKLSELVGRCEEEPVEEEETEPTLETDVGAEEVDDEEKPKKDKPDEEPDEATAAPEAEEGPELPPPSNGNGGGETAPPVAQEPEEAPSPGGVGPSEGVE